MFDRFVGVYSRRPLLNLFELWGITDMPPAVGNRLVALFPDRTVTVTGQESRSVNGEDNFLVEEEVAV